MAIFGVRMDIFMLVWFLAMGMVNYLDAQTGVLSYQVSGKYGVDEISSWQGLDVDDNSGMFDVNEPRAQPEENTFRFLDSFVYQFKQASWVTNILVNITFGLHTWLRDTFGIPYMPWGIPIMVLVNLANILGLYELWTKVGV